MPPLENGWHFKILLAESFNALKTGYFFRAWRVYSEQDGVNLQDFGKNVLIAIL